VQCRQASELLQFTNQLQNGKVIPTIIAGDLNTYIDYEYPIDLLGRKVASNSRCIPIWDSINFDYKKRWPLQFDDVWKVLFPTDLGFTFLSDTPGLDSCRPDRILSSQGTDLVINDAWIVNTETEHSKLSDHKALFAEFVIK